MDIKDNIRSNRKRLKMTQQELADRVGVSVHAIKMWESGKYEPTVKSLKALVAVFGVSAQELCGIEAPEAPQPSEITPDYILQHPSGRTAFIEEIMTMPEERFRHILKYSEFLKREASAEGSTDASGK